MLVQTASDFTNLILHYHGREFLGTEPTTQETSANRPT